MIDSSNANLTVDVPIQKRISRELKTWLFFTSVGSIEHVDTRK